MTRSKYLERCKERAREYLDKGDVKGALASFLSDLSKNSETEPQPGLVLDLATTVLMRNNLEEAKAFVEGYK